MKLAKFFINLSYLGGCTAIFLRMQEIPEWNLVGALSFGLFVFSGLSWYSADIFRDTAFIKHERMNPFIIFVKAILVLGGLLGFIYTFTTRDTFFCVKWNGMRIAFIVVGCVIEFVVFIAYLYTFTSELKEERSEIAI